MLHARGTQEGQAVIIIYLLAGNHQLFNPISDGIWDQPRLRGGGYNSTDY